MTADDVQFVLTLLRRANVDVWIGGRWGIDALLGEQTRDHRDLDLMHRQDQEAAALRALGEAGFAESVDWRPIRFVMAAADGREIDLHPLVFADDGSAMQASPEPQRPFTYPRSCFVTGIIKGCSVPCLSAEQQVYFHQGYEPSERDRHDMAQLRRSSGITTHF
ncbi:nucleotidyltransferase domain-containing protein [Streptomyces longhuiensis]|uniref:nucleotidyltransferase domain-containing protein n=1 Tax=Streptomyces longhuiensis TaxID=2880933 RepID=UPI001D0AD5F0|nr:amino acid transporter [Streptomyces longhuiensis]UDL97305.1 amino acid transporter [Streptomyces longhuiensis]